MTLKEWLYQGKEVDLIMDGLFIKKIIVPKEHYEEWKKFGAGDHQFKDWACKELCITDGGYWNFTTCGLKELTEVELSYIPF